MLPGMVPWFVILISHLHFRRTQSGQFLHHPFRLPGSPFTNYLALFMLSLTLIFMVINPQTRLSVLVGCLFLVIMSIRFLVKQHQGQH